VTSFIKWLIYLFSPIVSGSSEVWKVFSNFMCIQRDGFLPSGLRLTEADAFCKQYSPQKNPVAHSILRSSGDEVCSARSSHEVEPVHRECPTSHVEYLCILCDRLDEIVSDRISCWESCLRVRSFPV
jgi:hypothetical protein